MFGLTRKRTPQQLWNLHKEDFLKIYAHEQSAPLTHAQLEKCFVDKKGVQYYRFPEAVALPVERLGQRSLILQWMSAGLTADEQNKFLDEIDKAVMDGLTNKDKKAAARVGSCTTQMRDRQKMVLHTELLYNFLAVQWVRKDENPTVYNNEIQMQKVEQFKEETASGNSYFFFQQKELKKLNDLWNFTEAEWNKYWEESKIKIQATKEALETFSQTASKKFETLTKEMSN